MQPLFKRKQNEQGYYINNRLIWGTRWKTKGGVYTSIKIGTPYKDSKKRWVGTVIVREDEEYKYEEWSKEGFLLFKEKLNMRIPLKSMFVQEKE